MSGAVAVAEDIVDALFSERKKETTVFATVVVWPKGGRDSGAEIPLVDQHVNLVVKIENDLHVPGDSFDFF